MAVLDSSDELTGAPRCPAADIVGEPASPAQIACDLWVISDSEARTAHLAAIDVGATTGPRHPSAGEPSASMEATSAAQQESLQFQSNLILALREAVIATDVDFTIVLINDAAAALYGVTAEQVIGRSSLNVIETDWSDTDLPTAHHQLVTAGHWSGRVVQKTSDGRSLQVELNVTLVRDEHGRVQGTVCVARDVTRSRAAEQDVARRMAFTANVLESLPGRTCVVDRNGTVIAVNRRYRYEGPSGAGPGTGPRIGTDYLQWLAGATDQESVQDLQQLLAGECSDYRTEFGTVRHRRRLWTELFAVPLSGQDGGSVITHTDITVRKQTETALTKRATHDPLTGLPNRTLLGDRLAHALSRAARNGGQVGILFCDLDGLRAVNNSFGHVTGDQLLITIARRLRAVCRSSDTVARVSGDEFVVVLDDAENRTQVEEAAQRIIDALGEPVVLEETVAKTGASIGLLLSSGVQRPGVRTVEKLIRDADTAMYAAKDAGRGRYVWFSPEMREHPKTRPSFVQAINRLLNR